MRRNKKTMYWIRAYLYFVFVIVLSSNVCGQTKQPQPLIMLKDSVLKTELEEYIKIVKAKVVGVFVERYDGDYTYTFYNFGFVDTIEKNPTKTWGYWKGCVLLLYMGAEDILAVNNVSEYESLHVTVKTFLPRQFVTTKLSNGIEEEELRTFTPTIWRIKVRDNKLLWKRQNLAYQSEKIPYMKY